MIEKVWTYKETKLRIKCDGKDPIKSSIKASFKARQELESFIYRTPEFGTSFEPLNLEEGNYEGVIGLMIRASKIAHTGPFAAVAGAISQIASESGIRAGAENIMVDNGGDISIIGNRDFQVGIYAGKSPASGEFAFLVESEALPIGICTSSGTVGHSVSLGQADAVVISADEASIADAVATSVANEVSEDETESSVKNGLDKADDIGEIRGCLIIRDDRVGLVGDLPEILTTREGEKVKPAELTSSLIE